MSRLYSVIGPQVLFVVAMRVRRLSWAAAFLGLTLVRVDAQQELVPSFRAQSEVVLVDLVVTDKRGQFVHDLKPEEIQVFEDGKLQRLTFFDLRKRAGSEEQLVSDVRTGAVPAPAVASRTLPTTPQDRGYFVFLFDLQAMSFHGLERAKESIRRFARAELAPTDRVMVASIRPQFRVELPFTSDISRLDAALDQLVARDFEEASIARFIESLDHAFARMEAGALDTFDPGQSGAGEQRLDPNLDGAISQAADEGRALMVKVELQVDFTCAAIGALSRHLGSLPGRKQLIYFSKGYPLDAKRTVTHLISQRAITYSPGQVTLIHLAANTYMAGASHHSHLINRLQLAVRQANRAQVSVYSIDPRGLMVPAIANPETRGSGNYLYPTYSTEDITAPQQFLASLSMETGGLWFSDDNDLERPIRSAYRDGSRYYPHGIRPVLHPEKGQVPQDQGEGQEKKASGLRYREGYVEEDPREAETVDLANAFKFPDLFRDFPVDTQVLKRKGHVQVPGPDSHRRLHLQSPGRTEPVRHRNVRRTLRTTPGKWVGENFYFVEENSTWTSISRIWLISSATNTSSPWLRGSRRTGPATWWSWSARVSPEEWRRRPIGSYRTEGKPHRIPGLPLELKTMDKPNLVYITADQLTRGLGGADSGEPADLLPLHGRSGGPKGITFFRDLCRQHHLHPPAAPPSSPASHPLVHQVTCWQNKAPLNLPQMSELFASAGLLHGGVGSFRTGDET